jgi:hypothetical protein
MRHQISARVPESDYRLLQALAAVLHVSQADILARGLGALFASLPAATQKIVRALLAARE